MTAIALYWAGIGTTLNPIITSGPWSIRPEGRWLAQSCGEGCYCMHESSDATETSGLLKTMAIIL